MRKNASSAPALHQALVDHLKREGTIRSPHVEEAFRAVPRHLFLPEVPLAQVYSDEAIPTKHLDGRAVSSSSQPAIIGSGHGRPVSDHTPGKSTAQR